MKVDITYILQRAFIILWVLFLSTILLNSFDVFVRASITAAGGGCILFVLTIPPVIVFKLIFPSTVQPYTLEMFKHDLIKFALVTEDQIIGCTDEEIEEVKRSQNAESLPETYVRFLREFGKLPLNNSDYKGLFYPDNLNNLSVLKSYIENPEWRIPQHLFVISLIREPDFERAVFINMTDVVENPNPPVYFSKITPSSLNSATAHAREFRRLTDYLNDWVVTIYYELNYTP
ncbi:MAG: hypothetical protein RLP44_32525 [Aggregatilineales bacterium]